MKLLLRVVALTQVAFGAGYLVYVYSLDQKQRWLFRFETKWTDLMLPCLVVSLGCILWVATRAVYWQKSPPTPSPVPPPGSPPPVTPRPAVFGMASFLRILAAVQMASGVLIFMILVDFYLLQD